MDLGTGKSKQDGEGNNNGKVCEFRRKWEQAPEKAAKKYVLLQKWGPD